MLDKFLLLRSVFFLQLLDNLEHYRHAHYVFTPRNFALSFPLKACFIASFSLSLASYAA